MEVVCVAWYIQLPRIILDPCNKPPTALTHAPASPVKGF